MPHSLAEALLDWYARQGRDLPWRGTRDPYAILVAEVMSQQTRLETVVPYYRRWMARFPTLEALAAADEEEVLRLWEGLGYYRRARYLHQAARQVVAGGGELPRSVADLRRLPGVGPYTAAAVAAFAFDAPALALDGNLRRVLSRLIDLEIDPRSPEGERRLREAGEALLPPGRASAFNQALMDLGALVCTPARPDCAACPVQAFCLAHRRGTQAQRPVRPAARPLPERRRVSAVIWRRGRVLIGRRPPDKLLGGLWEFPGGKVDGGEALEAALRRELREELGLEVDLEGEVGVFRHAYTHYRLVAHVFRARLRDGRPRPHAHTALRWARPEELGDYPMGKVDRAIARRVAAGSG